MNLAATNLIRWIEPFAYKPGKPFRILPLGTFKRGERKLELTAERLKAMAANYEAGRPRWKIPIYFGHPTDENPDPPKKGNAKRLFFVDGDGLYAEPEFTTEGEKALAEGEYQFISPGVLWSLAGGEYTDEQGKKFDNVIDHVALTNRPFFGAATQLFDASDDFADMPEQPPAQPTGGLTPQPPMQHPAQHIEALKTIEAALKQVYAAVKAALAPQQPPAQPPAQPTGGPTPQPPASAPAKSGAAYEADPAKETAPMTQPTPDKLSAPQISAEEFAALKAKAAEVDKLQTQMAAMAESFSGEKRARRLDQLTARCERFTAIAVEPKELAPQLQKLEEKDAELFKYFDGLLESLDTALVQVGLFTQVADVRQGEGKTENYADFADKLWRDEFKADPGKVQEAYDAAAKRRPDLYDAYSNTYAPPKSRKSRAQAQ